MPIRLTCSACSKPMQAPDVAAGKRVKCPNCQAVVSVPMQAAAAAPAAVPARPAPPPVPPPAPPVPAAPAPAPVPATSDNPFGFDDAPVVKKARKPARDEAEDERPRKKKGRARDEDEEEEWEGEAPRKGAKGWSAFGAGCGSVKLGLWIEFGAIAYFGILFFLALAGVGGRGSPLSGGGGIMFLPIPLAMLAGTTFILLGRLKMMSAPKSSGASTVLLGAVLLTGLRGIAVLAGALFSVLAVANDGVSAAMYGSRAAMALLIGAAPGAVAELTVITAMALAGGCIPDENLRRKAGLLTFITQAFALAYFLLVALALLVGLDDGPPRGGMGRPGQFGQPQGGPPADPRTIMGVIVFVYLLLQFVYTALQASMYGAAQYATGNYGRRKPKFEDDEE